VNTQSNLPATAPGASAWLRLAAVVCGVATAVPFWVGRCVPFVDLPQHLAVISVLRHHGDAAWGFDRHFETEWGELTPYWTFYLATWGLSFLMSVETAARVFLTGYALLLPWAGIALCRAFGASTWLGLLAAGLALNANLYYGFISYCAAVVLMLVLIALFERSLAAPSVARYALLAVGSAVLFFTHAQVTAFFLGAVFLLAATAPALSVRARAARTAAVVPGLGLLLAWAYGQFVASRAGRTGGYDFGRLDSLRAGFRPLGESVAALPEAVAGLFQDRSDFVVLLMWVGLAGAAWPGSGAPRRRIALLAAAAAVAYFAAPLWIMGQWNIGPRFAWIAALLVVPACRATGRRAVLVGGLATALAVVAGANAALHHAAFDRESGAFDAAIDALPKGATVAPLVFDARGSVLAQWPYLHFGQYAMVRRGGLTAANLGRVACFPIRMREARTRPQTDPFRPGDFDFESVGRHYDYYLLRRAGSWRERLFPPGSVETVFESGDWTVLHRR
jgi:hypothetical protein